MSAPPSGPPAIDGFDISSFYEAQPAKATEEFLMIQTKIRVKNPKTSLDFYCKVLGFEPIWHSDFPQWGFSVYFLAPKPYLALFLELREKLKQNALSQQEKWGLVSRVPGCVELTWNHGSENESSQFLYNTGNADTTGVTVSDTVSSGEKLSSNSKVETKVKGGFGHLGISVPDVYEACARFKELGAVLHKSPNSGGMKGLAFVKDPDGYLVEVGPQGAFITKEIDCNGVRADAEASYKDNSK